IFGGTRDSHDRPVLYDKPAVYVFYPMLCSVRYPASPASTPLHIINSEHKTRPQGRIGLNPEWTITVAGEELMRQLHGGTHTLEREHAVHTWRKSSSSPFVFAL
ncbi:unnamed protein product, partial [Ectocarpus sp. 4 AP-2014]